MDADNPLAAPPPTHDVKPPAQYQPFAPKVLQFLGASPTTDRTAIAEACVQYGEVAFVDFRFGETVGYVRFKRHEGARAASDVLASTPIELNGATPTWHLLDQAESKQYWKLSGKRKAEALE